MQKVALVLAVLLGAPAVASAGSGGFVSLGIGGTANVGGDLDAGSAPIGGSGKAGSLFVGQEFGMFGLEVGLTRYGLENDSAIWTNTGLAAAGRFTVPIRIVFGAYVRAGIEKTWMTPDGDSGATHSGTGWLAGLGAEYKLSLGKLSGSVWADLTRHDTGFVTTDRPQVSAMDGSVDILQLGVTVGF